jgi:peptide/nickel transport system ATP-binding protein
LATSVCHQSTRRGVGTFEDGPTIRSILFSVPRHRRRSSPLAASIVGAWPTEHDAAMTAAWPRPAETQPSPSIPGDTLVVVDDLKVHFPIKRGVVLDRTVGYVYAVDGVSLTVRCGETYGLVGESGCGKSTLGRAMLRLEELTAGSVIFDGVDLSTMSGERLRRMRRRMQMVFQDPLSSLDPRQSVESLLVEGLRAHGLDRGREATAKRLRELMSAVGLPVSGLRKYPHEFSGGQRQRIGVARALAVEPDLIVADEPVSALDVSVQAQVINLLEDLQEEFGLTYLVIAHDLAVVRHISDRVGVMYLGGLVEEAASDDLYETPLHPYTRALLSAVPVPDPVVEDRRERILLVGDLPSPAAPPAGCRFHTRCPWRQPERCDEERPVLRSISSPGVPADHKVACHWAEDILSGRLQPHAVQAEAIELVDSVSPDAGLVGPASVTEILNP